MRVSKRLIKDVVSEIAGNDGIRATNFMDLDGGVAEEDLAKMMDQEIKSTRNTLYKLQKHNLVEFRRKRNDANGWYTYYWTFNKERVRELANKLIEARLERLNYQLNVEQNTQFFKCKNTCMRIDFERVVSFDYKCPECGNVLMHEDNKKRIKEIKLGIKETMLKLKKKR